MKQQSVGLEQDTRDLIARCVRFVQPLAAQIAEAEIVQPVAGQSIPPVLFLTTFTNLVEIINRVRTAQERLFYIVDIVARLGTDRAPTGVECPSGTIHENGRCGKSRFARCKGGGPSSLECRFASH